MVGVEPMVPGWDEKSNPLCYYFPYVWVNWNIITVSFCSISAGHKHFSCHDYPFLSINFWQLRIMATEMFVSSWNWTKWNCYYVSVHSNKNGFRPMTLNPFLSVNFWQLRKCHWPETIFGWPQLKLLLIKKWPATPSPEGPEVNTEMRGFKKFQYIQEKLSILALYVIVILCLLIFGNFSLINLKQ